MKPNVVVVGSLNIDYIASVQRLPALGETVGAAGLIQRFGGKGANQAVAAARQGARVSLIGCVGNDASGRAYRRRLRQEGIQTGGIGATKDALTGTALIAVDQAGENIIVVAPGANGALTTAAIRAHRKLIARAGILLLQFEVPLAAVLESIRIANQAQVPVVLNPSPPRADFPYGKCRIDTLITNAGEAAAIFGLSPESLPASRAKWQRALAERRIGCLLITQGAKPTLAITADEWMAVRTLPVRPVDTVGAGDAFAGTLAARRAEGMSLREAVRFANCAGALATLKAGAQEAIPTRAATDRAVRRLREAPATRPPAGVPVS